MAVIGTHVSMISRQQMPLSCQCAVCAACLNQARISDRLARPATQPLSRQSADRTRIRCAAYWRERNEHRHAHAYTHRALARIRTTQYAAVQATRDTRTTGPCNASERKVDPARMYGRRICAIIRKVEVVALYAGRYKQSIESNHASRTER